MISRIARPMPSLRNHCKALCLRWSTELLHLELCNALRLLCVQPQVNQPIVALSGYGLQIARIESNATKFQRPGRKNRDIHRLQIGTDMRAQLFTIDISTRRSAEIQPHPSPSHPTRDKDDESPANAPLARTYTDKCANLKEWCESVAQLVEHRPFKALVLGSNPSALTILPSIFKTSRRRIRAANRIRKPLLTQEILS
jgi:hypothetical protein